MLSVNSMYSFAALSGLIIAGCGGAGTDPSVGGGEMPRELVLVDSIGIEMGDSNYVFGVPRALEFTSTGNIVVGDISTMRMSMFSTDGEFLRSGGTEGQGPGEYSMPSGISPTLDGGILVSDAMGGKLIIYDSLLNFSHEITGFMPYPPQDPQIVSDGSVIGTRITFDQESGTLSNTLGSWSAGDAGLVMNFLERSSGFDQSDPRKAYYETGISFCVLPDERVVAAPSSSEEYRLMCFELSGELSWEMNRPFERRRRPDEEMEIERELMRAAMVRSGRDPSYVDSIELREWATAVSAVYCQNDRIWVRRGGYLVPTFDVYSMEGDYLHSCSVPSLPWGVNVGFCISPYSDLILAYLANPEDYSRIWILTESGDGEEGPVRDPDGAAAGGSGFQPGDFDTVMVTVSDSLPAWMICIHYSGTESTANGFRRIDEITVSDPVSGSFETFGDLESNVYQMASPDQYLISEDMNFDGYDDFRLMKSPSAGPNTCWYFWLYETASGSFRRWDEIEALDVISPEFNSEERTVASFHRDGYGEYGREEYAVNDHLPVLIRREQTEFVEPDSLITTVYAIVDGEETVVERRVEIAE